MCVCVVDGLRFQRAGFNAGYLRALLQDCSWTGSSQGLREDPGMLFKSGAKMELSTLPSGRVLPPSPPPLKRRRTTYSDVDAVD